MIGRQQANFDPRPYPNNEVEFVSWLSYSMISKHFHFSYNSFRYPCRGLTNLAYWDCTQVVRCHSCCELTLWQIDLLLVAGWQESQENALKLANEMRAAGTDIVYCSGLVPEKFAGLARHLG